MDVSSVFDKAPPKTFKCNGAILADDTGTGKTVTALALVHAHRFTSVGDLRWDNPMDSISYLPSRATIVVCPSHLAAQWRLEALKCMPNCKVKLLTTIIDHRKLSWNDVLLSDLIIVSLSFLQNNNCILRVAALTENQPVGKYMSNLRAQGRAVFGPKVGVCILSV